MCGEEKRRSRVPEQGQEEMNHIDIVLAHEQLLQIAFGLWMFGVSIAHLLRFVVMEDLVFRQVVASAGAFIYFVAALLSWGGVVVWAYWIGLVFPLFGISAVVVSGWISDDSPEDGIFGTSVDLWQLAVGVTQFSALIFCVIALVLGPE
jgi:hypothetical protein